MSTGCNVSVYICCGHRTIFCVFFLVKLYDDRAATVRRPYGLRAVTARFLKNRAETVRRPCGDRAETVRRPYGLRTETAKLQFNLIVQLSRCTLLFNSFTEPWNGLFYDSNPAPFSTKPKGCSSIFESFLNALPKFPGTRQIE